MRGIYADKSSMGFNHCFLKNMVGLPAFSAVLYISMNSGPGFFAQAKKTQ